MNREAFEFTTTNGHKVVMKTYLTVRELRAIEAIYLTAGKIDELGKAHFEASPEMIQGSEDEAIKQAVVSVDGEIKNILDTILNFKSKKDFDEIKAKIDELGKSDDKKKA